MYLNRIITYLFLFLIGIGGFFGNVNINIQNQDNQINAIISYETNISYASTTAEPAKKDDASTKTVEAYNSMITTLNIILYALSAIITPIVLFVGWLMSPDWTSGDLFNLREPMYKLWITVSNIVYFIYAILLIFIALGTMFNQDKFSYKVMLPKLALGILMVPFTWWFVQWTISIASVVTASVMTIPAETIVSSDSKWFTEKSIPMNVNVDNTWTGSKTSPSKCPDACISPKQFLEKWGWIFWPMIVYGYSIFKFQEIKSLSTGVDIASAALNIVHSSVVGAIMFLVFWLLTLALAAMLFVRAIKLWMYAIFSPLFTFRFVAGSNLLWGDDDSFSLKEFIGLAFVPAIVWLTLSFGLIIINAVQWPAAPKWTSTSSTQPCNLEWDWCLIANIMGSPENKILRKIKTDEDSGQKYSLTMFTYGDITFSFLGKTVNQSKEETTGIGAIDAVGGMFGTLIIDIIALVFIWMAFMAAKNVSKWVKAAVQPFEDMGSKIGGIAKSMPKYAPILPPSLWGSMYGAWRIADQVGNLQAKAAEKKVNESSIGRMVWLWEQASDTDMKKVQELLKANHTIGSIESQAIVSKLMANGGKHDQTHTFKEFWEYLKKNTNTNSKDQKAEFLIKWGMDEEIAKKIAHIIHVNNNVDPHTNKELEELWKKAGEKWTSNTTTVNWNGTTSAAATWNWVISINGVNINYNGIDLKSTPTQIWEKVANYLNTKKADMEKPTETQIKKLVESLWVDALKEADTVKKIIEKLDSSGFKTKP